MYHCPHELDESDLPVQLLFLWFDAMLLPVLCLAKSPVDAEFTGQEVVPSDMILMGNGFLEVAWIFCFRNYECWLLEITANTSEKQIPDDRTNLQVLHFRLDCF